ncbi:hypothetical protein EOPP23_03515 [Endozoicomonas sp. OPT23]|nr:hypothetical protein [Endozoicomonas sp. OPT23]
MLPISSEAESSDTDFTQNSHYSTSYSRDVSTIDPFTLQNVSSKSKYSVPELGSRKKNIINKDDVGKLLYKTLKNPKKVAGQAAAGAAMVGLNYLEVAKPLKEGVVYIKEKTRFKFGDCGQVRFSSKLKAKTCLMDNSNIELNSSYKMDKVTVNFNWAL